MRPSLSRRILIGAGGAGIASGMLRGGAQVVSAAPFSIINVLCPILPDPIPPGATGFYTAKFYSWEYRNELSVNYEQVAWERVHEKNAVNFKSGQHVHDAVYVSGWVPEFFDDLAPIPEKAVTRLAQDMPASSFNTVTWNGEVRGLTFTLNLLTLYVNTEHLQSAGLSNPPANWDELKGFAAELTNEQHAGWTINYGTPAGIGGTASYWMTFLQQAGGRMYGEDGLPAFYETPGIEALQLMIDLMPSSRQSVFDHTSIVDATNQFGQGQASMMMNWPFAWRGLQSPDTSTVQGKVATAILPAGAVGSASLDGADAWSLTARAKDPELTMQLLDYFLNPLIQKDQVLLTGWLPIRKSVYTDADVQAVAPHGAVVLQQSEHPYDSFVTPDYADVTQAIGTEITRALRGDKTADQAIKDAYDEVTAIVKKRLAK